MSAAPSSQPPLHPELQAVLGRFREARAQPPETFKHWPGVLERPSFFDVDAFQRHLSNPLLQPHWVSLVFRGQDIPLEQACCYKIVQTKQLLFIDKRFLDGYLAQGASVVLEGLDLFDPGINAFVAELDAGFPLAFSNCVAFFSQRGNEAYRGHFDSDDVFVIHISGEKRWRLFARQQSRRVNTYDLTPEQMGPQIGELTMRPGDLLYVRSGVPHICDTAASHSLHLSFDLCDRTPTVEYQLQMALDRYKHATSAPYSPAPEVAGAFADLLRSPAMRGELEQRTEALRSELRAFRERIAFAGRVTSLSRYAKG
jgi:Cupin superfamily protein